jgi:hypothetical protein
MKPGIYGSTIYGESDKVAWRDRLRSQLAKNPDSPILQTMVRDAEADVLSRDFTDSHSNTELRFK